MSSKLEIKDSVFASYLVFSGCRLLTIEPYCPPNPKRYIFDGDVRNGPYEAQFFGAGCPRAKATWLDFKNKMDNLQAMEDHLLRHSSRRVERHGKEDWHGTNIFVTSSQVMAAFLLSRDIQIHEVSEIKKGRAYLFAFLEPEKAHELSSEMLNGSMVETWYGMKSWYKLATRIRIYYCRPKKQRPQEQLRAS